MELTEIRKEIDAIDDQMAQLFVRRMRAVDAVAASKRASGAPVRDFVRENEILSRVGTSVGSELAPAVRRLFDTLMALSRERQGAANGVSPTAMRAALVTDSNVDRLHGDAVVRKLENSGLTVERIVFPAGEKSKTLETYVELVRGFAALGLTRSDFVLALGGGVVGDLAGFAAATYLRGIDVVQMPTTLLAMVDSSIGGKTGVDIPEGKNLVGAFHLPKRIIRETHFLKTLPEKEMKNGYAEMIKTAILFDRDLFAELRALADLSPAERLARLDPLISRTAAWKEKIVAEDFREGGVRKLLNLGHTFGHALERASDFRLSHGEAVAVGMRIVGRQVPEIGEILDRFGFPNLDDPRLSVLLADRETLLAGIGHDKKRSGDSITLVVPREIGRCELVETPIGEVSEWLE